MALNFSGKLTFEIHHPGGLDDSDYVFGVVVRQLVAGGNLAFVINFSAFDGTKFPMDTTLIHNTLLDGGVFGSVVYASSANVTGLSVGYGLHSITMTAVNGDVGLMIDNWQVDASASQHVPQIGGSTLVSYHLDSSVMINGSLTSPDAWFGPFPYQNLAAGELCPADCTPTAPGSISYSSGVPLTTAMLDSADLSRIGDIYALNFSMSGQAFWTERYLAQEI